MFEFIANNAYIFCIIFLVFYYLYWVGGEDIIFFRKKRYPVDPKAAEKVNSVLTRFARHRNFEVLGPTTIEFEGETYSFDAILLSHAGTMVFAVKPEIGDFYTDFSKNEWAHVYNRQRTTFPNPLLEMENNVKLFRDIYRAEGVKFGTTTNMVVYTNKHANVATTRNTPTAHVDFLGEKLANSKLLADANANVEGMKAAIEKYKK